MFDMEINVTESGFTSRETAEINQLYTAAMKEIVTKLEILSDEFELKYSRNPIHHIESRIKSEKSIINKLVSKGKEISVASAKENLNDIAGIRVVCSYIDDVYSIADMLLRQSDITLVKKQDYIKNPNFNGYRSLHLDIRVPVFFSESSENVAAEIQIRTVAMDFWASLEHDLRYKTDKDIPTEICDEMFKSADEIARIDIKMQEIYKKIQKIGNDINE